MHVIEFWDHQYGAVRSSSLENLRENHRLVHSIEYISRGLNIHDGEPLANTPENAEGF
jgi:hypothetical protein